MPEFSAIDKHLKKFSKDASVLIGIGDDAAVVECPEDHHLVQTLDVMVEGIHFDETYTATQLAHKLLHVNLSDIAAMGATPKWATIGMAVPSLGDDWLADFSNTLNSQANRYGVNLIGGDTSQGVFALSLNLTGLIAKSSGVLTRNGAYSGDDIYVSGTLGDAALALESVNFENKFLQKRLRLPEARVELGIQLNGLASACLDVSDGLLQDLSHICQQSQLNAVIHVENLPFSKEYMKVTDSPDYALNGGDDYELCFTASPQKREALEQLSQQLNIPLSRIGVLKDVVSQSKIECLLDGTPYICQRKGWQHFQVSDTVK